MSVTTYVNINAAGKVQEYLVINYGIIYVNAYTAFTYVVYYTFSVC
jgi:hypothetical protein